MNLSITPISNNQATPQFKGSNPNLKYKNIKLIPNVPCACCGKKVLIPTVLSKAFAAVSRPLLSLFKDKNSALYNWQQGKIFIETLHQMAQDNPKKSFEQLMQNVENWKKIQDAIFVQLMQKGEPDIPAAKTVIYNDILSRSRATLRSSSVVMKKFAPLNRYLDGIKLETSEQLEIYSRKYPKKTLSEIINMPEIYEFHRTKDLLQRAETKERVDYRFENIKNMVKKVNPDAVEEIEGLKEQALDIFALYVDENIRMEKIKCLYDDALKKNHCEKLIKKVRNEIDKMPKSYITMDSFFVFARNHNFNDGQILNSIYAPVVSTFEHVVPRSQEGKDSASNGLVMHASCNKARRSIPYKEYFSYHPEMPKNIQKQVNHIARRILSGSFDKSLNFWPMHIANTLYKYTDGLIQIDLTKHCEKGLQMIQDRVDSRNSLIDKLKGDYDSKLNQKMELQKQIENLDSEMDGINAMSQDLAEQNKNEKSLKSSYSNHIKIQKKKKSKPE